MTVRFLVGDVREQLRLLPDESVHCVVTSPPYWGLRDYGTACWEGGDPACDHGVRRWDGPKQTQGAQSGHASAADKLARQVCRCGAQRVDNQLGLEPTPQEHVERMVSIFRDVRRVLRKDGVCWVNYGDSYATSVNGRSAADTKASGNDDRTFRDKPFGTATPNWKKRVTALQDRADVDVGGWGNRDDSLRWRGGDLLKAKDLCMVPFRFALAMQADGWWLRSVLPWVKRNAMPESIRDRPATAIEYVFMFARSERYAYDAEAVRQPLALSSGPRKDRDARATGDTSALSGAAYEPPGQAPHAKARYKMPDNWDTGPGGHGSFHRQGREKGRPAFHGSDQSKFGDDTNGQFRRHHGASADKQRGHGRRHAGFNDRWDDMGRAEQQANGRNFRNSDLFFESIAKPHGLLTDVDGEPLALDVAPKPFREAHFATFPPKLIEPLIKAGAPEHGCCPQCGAPWRRQVAVSYEVGGPKHGENAKALRYGRDDHLNAEPYKTRTSETIGWEPRCKCPAHEPVPCTVLDPFGGSGTTALVAEQLGRNSVLIELNPEYVEIARKRLGLVEPDVIEAMLA